LDLVLYTPEGFAVLEDWSADDPAWQGRRFPLGPVRTICTIPGTLLNEGTFRVRVMFLDGDTVRPIYDFDDQVYFEVFDDTPRAISWNGKFLGPLRPKLGWRTKAIVDERVPEMSDPLNP
jgi:lipopolysaccharide transport system ATP-binding protein